VSGQGAAHYGSRHRSLDMECWEYELSDAFTAQDALRDLADTLDRTSDVLLSLQVVGEGGDLIQAFVEPVGALFSGGGS
jgi:hypothetical protein